MHGAAAGRALRHAAGADAARDGARKPRHAYGGSREEGGWPAAQADRADDPVLPPGPVRRHPGSRGDPGDADEPAELARLRIDRTRRTQLVRGPLITISDCVAGMPAGPSALEPTGLRRS